LQEFRKHTKKNQARLWIPVETSLLVRYEFASCSLQTRYVFVAIVLYCGANGLEEIPLDAKFMSSVLVADERTVAKSLDELLFKKLLLEREKEREKSVEKNTQTERENENGVCVSVDFSRSPEENRDEEKEKTVSNKRNSNSHLSQFSLEECLSYVEICQSKGDSINNPKALAMNLFKTGEADAFILAILHPEQSKKIDSAKFGEAIGFTDEPCSVCFGGKMADVDGKGYRPCEHCKNEKGRSVGYEPKEKNRDEAKKI
jgi:hypothetical protein